MDLNPIIIGIAGGTGSGKSTLAENIRKEFADNISMLSHDYYYKSYSELTFDERKKMNFDHPDAFDTDLLIKHLKELKSGKTIFRPVYSFVSQTREDQTVEVVPKKVILLDGILIFENKELRDMMDIKIYVDTDADIRFIRRLLRDVKDRGRSLDSVIEQYRATVKPMHEQFVEPSKRYADIIVPEGGYNHVALNMIIEKIRSII